MAAESAGVRVESSAGITAPYVFRQGLVQGPCSGISGRRCVRGTAVWSVVRTTYL